MGREFQGILLERETKAHRKVSPEQVTHSFYSTVVDGSPILQHGPAQKKTQGLAEQQKSVGLTSGLAPFLTSL